MTHPPSSLRDRRADKLTVRSTIARRVFILFGSVGLAGGLVALIYGVYLIRQTQVDNTTRNKILTGLVARVNDCTTPKGDCYEQQQAAGARLGQSVSSQVNDIVVAASACAVGVPADLPVDVRRDMVKRCTDDALRESSHQ